MTKSSIIEVKSGKVRHKTRQFLEQKDLAREHNKEHIVYAPDITEKKYLELTLRQTKHLEPTTLGSVQKLHLSSPIHSPQKGEVH